jgi:hypothetical protein
MLRQNDISHSVQTASCNGTCHINIRIASRSTSGQPEQTVQSSSVMSPSEFMLFTSSACRKKRGTEAPRPCLFSTGKVLGQDEQ